MDWKLNYSVTPQGGLQTRVEKNRYNRVGKKLLAGVLCPCPVSWSPTHPPVGWEGRGTVGDKGKERGERGGIQVQECGDP